MARSRAFAYAGVVPNRITARGRWQDPNDWLSNPGRFHPDSCSSPPRTQISVRFPLNHALLEHVDAYARQRGLDYETSANARRRDEALSAIRQALGPAQARAAEERGAAMSLDTAAEYALMLTAPAPPPTAAGTGRGKLSAREQELVTLVAQGRTDTQIASDLFISIRTVRSHLDRIRDKTGCRRRADLTRLALAEGLI